MMSTLTLYYKSLVNRDKSFILDNPTNGSRMIETYLATLTSQSISGFQYMKHALNTSIKINKSQEDLMMGYNSKDLNYCKIQNGTENPCYYFIIGKKWVSENTIQLDLHMDTLNTFTFNSDYIINKKTLVKREHKDRWKKVSLSLWVNHRFRVAGLNAGASVTSSWYYDDRLKASILYNPQISGTETIRNGLYSVSYELDVSNGRWRFTYTNTSGSAVSGLYLAQMSVSVTTNTYEAIMNLKSEEINAPLYKKSEQEINNTKGITWLLLYQNANNIDENAFNEVNPVNCYLIPKTAVSTRVGLEGNVLPLIPDGSFVALSPWILPPNKDDRMEFGIVIDGHIYPVKESEFLISGYFIVVQNDGGTYKAWRMYWNGQYSYQQESLGTISTCKIQNCPQYIRLISVSSQFATSEITNWEQADIIHDNSYTTELIEGEYSIDRTDSKNIKIIEIPYPPTTITGSQSSGIVMSPEWGLVNSKLFLWDNNVSFDNTFISDASSPFNKLFISGTNFDASSVRNDNIEPKIYHSDYYRSKFVYDSFSLSFYLELLDADDYFNNHYNDNLIVDFVMSRNIVSKFCFVLPQYTLKNSLIDYPNVVNVARNNEQVLYTSQYINYLRTGYNYDLKSKQRNEVAGGVGLGLSIAGTIGGVIGSVATQNYPAAILSGVAGAIAISSQIVNYAKNVAQAEQNIAQKLQEAQNQAVSVQNADDIDLLNAYSHNLAKLCEYEISDDMKQVMLDLFYYCGYKSNEQKVPNVLTRYYFNYLEADLVITDSENLPENIEEDIKEKFSRGVTFLHYRSIGFNFAQDKNNIEVFE